MKTDDIKEIAERTPFRPFTVRLNNGMIYRFESPRDIGAPKDYRMIFFFTNNQAVRIDADSITEIVEA
jgi:hypothetical protein